MSFSFEPTTIADFDSLTISGGCSFTDSGGGLFNAQITTDGEKAYGTRDVFGADGSYEFWMRFKLGVGIGTGIPTGGWATKILSVRDIDGAEQLRIGWGIGDPEYSFLVGGNVIDLAFANFDVKQAPAPGGADRVIEVYVRAGGYWALFIDGRATAQSRSVLAGGGDPVPFRWIDFGIVSETASIAGAALDFNLSQFAITNDRDHGFYYLDDAAESLVAHDGFEHGVAPSVWSPQGEGGYAGGSLNGPRVFGSPVLDGGIARGSYSLLCDTIADSLVRAVGWGRVLDGSPPLGCPVKASASFYVYVAVLPDTGSVRLCGFDADAANHSGAMKPGGGIVLDSNGNLFADANGGDNSMTFGACIAAYLGEWIHIDVAFNAVGALWTLDWKINGVAMPQDLAIPGGYFAGIDVIAVGFQVGVLNESFSPDVVTSTQKMVAYFDDVAVSRRLSDFPLGPIKHAFNKPTAVGTHVDPGKFSETTDNEATSTVLTGADATSWALLDDWPPLTGASADGIFQSSDDGSAAAYVEYEIANLGAGVPLAVQLLVALHKLALFDNGQVSGLALGSETIWLEFTSNAGINVLSLCQGDNPRDPAGNVWTQANLNAALFKWGRYLSHNSLLLDAFALSILLADTELAPLPDAALVQCALAPPIDPGGILGCGDYQVSVWSRGLRFFVGILPETGVSWERVIDDTSVATVTVEGFGVSGAISDLLGVAACSGEVCFAEPWISELVVHRQNSAQAWERPWSGPIQKLTMDPENERATIEARDLSAWWDHRRIHKNHLRGKRDPISNTYSQTDDVGTLFKRYADDAMQPDNTPGIVVDDVTTGILTIRPVRASQFLISALVLRELSQAGIDWTVVDRDVLLGAKAIPGLAIGPILPRHLAARPIVTLDGSQQANNVVSIGDGSGPSGVSVNSIPDADGVTEDDVSILSYGLLETVASSKVQTIAQANADANSRLLLAKDALVIVSEVRLLPSAPFPMSTLIPGVEADLHLEAVCGAQPATQRIERVNVARNGRGEEVVILTFMPPGTTPT